MAVMRTTLWPALAQAAVFNLNRQQAGVRLFEIGVCFHPSSQSTDSTDLSSLQQAPRVAGVAAGSLTTEQWGIPPRNVDFFDIKGDLEQLFTLTHTADFTFVPAQHPALHPGRSAAIQRMHKTVGYVGELHPELQQSLGLPVPTYLFELALEAVLPTNLPCYTTPSKYPSIRRDLAFIVAEHISFHQIEQVVHTHSGEALQNLQLFDIYQGHGIAPGYKSMAMGLTFQLTSRTLIDEEVDKAVQQVVEGLKQTFQATLRD